MPEVVEVEVGQASVLTGPLKGVPYIIPPIPGHIVKHPRYVLSDSQPAEETPQSFIEWQSTCFPVLRLLESDKSMHHIDTVPREP